MQNFPAAITSASDSVSGMLSAGALTSDSQYANFDAVLNSFIEEGRTDYSGRPAGFSGLNAGSGALDELRGAEIVSSLRKRQVDEDALRDLEQLAASGAPLTVGRIFSLLSGNMRRTSALSESERDDFSMLLGKLGLDRNECEEMLALSDAGNRAAMWKKLSEKLAGMDGVADVGKKEFSALLKGLDVSDETARLLRKLFGDADEQIMNGAGLEALLGAARNEQAKKEESVLHTRAQLRAAVDEALKAAKLKEHNAPVDNMRGSRQSEQSQAVMRDSVLKKLGLADHDEAEEKNAAARRADRELSAGKLREAAEQAVIDKEEAASAHARRHGNDAAGRGAGDDAAGPRAADRKKAAADALDRMLQRIDLAGADSRTENASPQAQNLNSLAGRFRQEIFSQVENGLLQSARDGASRLTLQLNPGELGELTVLLSLRQGELNATIRTDNQDAASVIREQLAELKASLEAQGIKVKDLDVRMGMNDNAFAGQWNGHGEHNSMRESAERDRLIRLSRIRRGEAAAAGGGDALHAREYITESTGLHIVA
jgi:flagellar hook-length control protein FliK